MRSWSKQWMVLVGLMAVAAAALAQTPVKASKGMTSYVLENAYVRAEIERGTGDLRSLKYKGEEMMGYSSGHHAGYWEQNPSGASTVTDGLSIDPATNGGERAEVFVKGVANGKGITRTSNGTGMICDLEIRYTLGKDDHGLYTYAIFTHRPEYGATGIGESRWGAKLTPDLDWLSIDSRRNQLMPTGYDWDHGQQMNMKEARRLTTGAFVGKVEHKYDYSADLFETPTFGWSSTKKHVGIYFVNPSQEFLSGGPTKVELTGHLDDGAGGDRTLLDYWRSTHYGGSDLNLAAGEDWNKVVGPIFMYLNSAATPEAMYADALAEGARQQKLWPYAWVKGVDYPQAAERSAVSGRLTIHDVKPEPARRMLIGLIPPGEGDPAGPNGAVWQRDAKHYQFWVQAGRDGSFTIPKVRPGTYELHGLADGVMGEWVGPKVTVAGGKPVEAGALTWKPTRYGRQLWEIGVPNRNAGEFLMGDQYFHWGLYLLYAKLFPNDVHYTVGKSNWAKDWYFEQVPNVAGQPAGSYTGKDTTWTIDFSVDGPQKGVAVLRTGICGAAARHVFVTVNGKDVGDLAPLVYNATINRDGIQGTWSEHDVNFPAELLKPGVNQIGLRVPGGNVLQGVMYDSLRLEVDESGRGASAAGGHPGPAPGEPNDGN